MASSTRLSLYIACASIVFCACSWLWAGTPQFNLPYDLFAAGSGPAPGANSGTNSIALPYDFSAMGITDACELRDYVNAAAGSAVAVVSISRFLPDFDALQTEAGSCGPRGGGVTNFALSSGESYRIVVSQDVTVPLIGDHDPGFVRFLDSRGSNGSNSGINAVAVPYNSVAASASELRDEIDAQAGTNAVVSISRFQITSDSLLTYTGASSATDFPLVDGEGLRIQVRESVAWVPAVD